MIEEARTGSLEATVRGVASAARALRLYPAASPIPRSSIEAASASLGSLLQEEPVLALDVARDGFEFKGEAVAASGGGSDLAEMLRSHGIAQVVFLPGCAADDLLSFLDVVMRPPDTVRAAGGAANTLSATGCSAIRLVTVSLSVAIVDEPAEGEDVDEFFRQLAGDVDKLATWLAAAAAGDPATFAEGLCELADAAEDRATFYRTMAAAFLKQETDTKDVLLGTGMEDGRAREIVGGMLGGLGTEAVSSSLMDGLYGRNMLSLSTALTRLPLGETLDAVIAEVRAALPSYGHDGREAGFLEHMLEVRANPVAEGALAASDPSYAEVAAAAVVDEGTVESKRAEVSEEVSHTTARSVPAMLALLDQQRDFALYVKSLDALAALVPKLVAQADLRTALRVLQQIAERESRASQPWPELTQRLRAALSRATGRETMAPLLDLLLADPAADAEASAVLRLADEAGRTAFVEEALARDDERALDVAETLLGRRMIDMLAAAVPHAGAGRLRVLVRRLARHADERASSAIRAALKRPDEIARAEAADALGGTTNPAYARELAALLSDPSTRVAASAARALTRTRLPGCAEALCERLEAIDVDGRDFDLGRELIACLAKVPDPVAGRTLKRLAERRTLIRRGRFNEVQQLAREAVAIQSRRAAG